MRMRLFGDTGGIKISRRSPRGLSSVNTSMCALSPAPRITRASTVNCPSGLRTIESGAPQTSFNRLHQYTRKKD